MLCMVGWNGGEFECRKLEGKKRWKGGKVDVLNTNIAVDLRQALSLSSVLITFIKYVNNIPAAALDLLY